MERSGPLLEKDLLSQADHDAALTAYEQAAAQLKSAEAQLDRACINLRYATIVSPIDGVVLSRDVDVGQTVAASFAAPTLFTIANDLRQMQVEASVDEADIGNIEEEQRVSFTVDAYPERQFDGRVSQVRLQPQMVENVVNYTVIVEVPNPSIDLMPGMTATLFVLVDERKDVLKVSNMALRFRPPPDDPNFAEEPDTVHQRQARWEEGRQRGQRQAEGRPPAERPIDFSEFRFARLWALREGKPAHVFIRTGISDGTYTEVVGGRLREGDEVILGYARNTSTISSSGSTNPFQPPPVRGRRRSRL